MAYAENRISVHGTEFWWACSALTCKHHEGHIDEFRDVLDVGGYVDLDGKDEVDEHREQPQAVQDLTDLPPIWNRDKDYGLKIN